MWLGKMGVMSGGQEKIRIFVAMPGTTMGPGATWPDVQQIKRRLLEPVAERVGTALARPHELVIEKDKISVGVIHRSMFREALDADVYIADLTGANPNVYLELGVRWALRDRVTIPICQDLTEVRFNVSANRVIMYGPMPDDLDAAVQLIADAAVEGLSGKAVDSPVRDGLDLIVLGRKQVADLESEVARLRQQQAEDLIHAALTTDDSGRKLAHLRLALERNPASAIVHLELGKALRVTSEYQEAVRALRRSTQLRDDLPEAWTELGIALSRLGDLEEASVAYERALALDDSSAEVWATLGGLRRRLARRVEGQMDWQMLKSAREAYARAAMLSGNDTYPRLNLARIELLLTHQSPESRAGVIKQFENLVFLATFAVEESGGRDPWKLFDLADALLVVGRVDEALLRFSQALDRIPPERRADTLRSVTEPIRDLLRFRVLDPASERGMEQVLDLARRATPIDQRHVLDTVRP